jgi:hypothetical protein
MAFKGTGAPEKGSSQWKKNEKTINENGMLRQMRDRSEGIEKKSGHYGQTHGGKGSAPRIDTNSEQYKDNFDRIFKQGKYKEDK